MTDEVAEDTGEKTEIPVLKHNQTENEVEILRLRRAVEDLTDKLAEATKNFEEAQERLESQARAKKIDRIQRVSKLDLGYLSTKTLEELDEIEEIYKHVKMPQFKSSNAVMDVLADEKDEALRKLNTMYKY